MFSRKIRLVAIRSGFYTLDFYKVWRQCKSIIKWFSIYRGHLRFTTLTLKRLSGTKFWKYFYFSIYHYKSRFLSQCNLRRWDAETMKKMFRIQHIERYKHDYIFLIVVQIFGRIGTVMNLTCHSDIVGFFEITFTVPLIFVFLQTAICNMLIPRIFYN